MARRIAVVAAVLGMVVLAGVWGRQAMSADGPATPVAPVAPGTAAAPAAPAAPTADKMKEWADQFRLQIMDRFKEQLGSTDEEWKVLQPRLEKVMTLSMQARFGGLNLGALLGGGRGGRGGGPAGGPGGGMFGGLLGGDAGASEIDKASAALQKALDNKEAKAEEIKAALSALRETRAKARQELETAQKALRDVLTVRQEAQLVTLGMLD